MIYQHRREIVRPSLEEIARFAPPFGSGLPLWTPIKSGRRPDAPNVIFGSNLKLWLRADLGITLNAGNVSAWADQSGAGHHFSQAVGGRQVPFDATGFGGLPCLSFDGSTQSYLEETTGSFLNMCPAAGHAVYAVVQPANTEADTNSWNEPAIFTDSAGNAALLTSTSAALRSSHWDGADRSTVVPAASGVRCVVRRLFSGGGSGVTNFSKNSGPDIGVAAGTMSATGGNALLGINYTASVKYHGLLSEIICIDRNLTSGELAAMDLYLAWMWGAVLPSAPSPATVSSTIGWWRADDAHDAGSGACDSLAPRLGSGDANKTLTQATGANRPTITATDSDFNNLPSLSFDTTDSLISGVFSAALSDPCWIFAVAKATDTTGTYYVCDDLAAGNRHSVFSSAGVLKGYETGFSFGSSAGWSGSAALVFVYDDTLGVSHVSAMTRGDQHAIGSTGTMTGLTLGNYLGGGAGGAKIADFAMGTGVLSLDDVYKLMTYARNRYGLTIAP